MQKANSLEGSAEGEDGRVFITANNAGGLVCIGLADDAVELKTRDLTALIMSTFREAREPQFGAAGAASRLRTPSVSHPAAGQKRGHPRGALGCGVGL